MPSSTSATRSGRTSGPPTFDLRPRGVRPPDPPLRPLGTMLRERRRSARRSSCPSLLVVSPPGRAVDRRWHRRRRRGPGRHRGVPPPERGRLPVDAGPGRRALAGRRGRAGACPELPAGSGLLLAALAVIVVGRRALPPAGRPREGLATLGDDDLRGAVRGAARRSWPRPRPAPAPPVERAAPLVPRGRAAAWLLRAGPDASGPSTRSPTSSGRASGGAAFLHHISPNKTSRA